MHSQAPPHTTQSLFQNFKQLIAPLAPYWKRVSLGLFLVGLIDILESFVPFLFKKVLDGIGSGAAQSTFFGLIFGILALHLVQGPLRLLWRVLILPPSHMACLALRQKFHRHLLHLGVPYSERVSTGHVLTLLNSDHEAIRMFLGPGLIVLVDGVVYILVIGTFLFFLSPKLVATVLIPLGLVPLLVGLFEKKLRLKTANIQKSVSLTASMGQAWIEGVRVLKLKAKEERALELYEQSSLDLKNQRLSYVRTQSLFQPSLDLCLAIGLIALVIYGEKAIATHVISIGTWVALTRYMQKLIWPLSALAIAVEHYQKARVSYQRLHHFQSLQSEADLVASSQHEHKLNDFGFVVGSTHRIAGASGSDAVIAIRDLQFRYQNHTKDALCIRTLDVKKGEWIFLKGDNGVGKSTLFKILMGHYGSYQGSIALEGKELKRYTLDQIRKTIAIVDQDPELLSGSLLNNLSRFSMQMEETARKSGALSEALEIASLGSGGSTKCVSVDRQVGYRGSRLSGGQRQRATLARAILREPRVLLLDDISSSLDIETEESVLENLRRLKDKLSVIVVSQRYSIRSLCDREFVLRGPER